MVWFLASLHRCSERALEGLVAAASLLEQALREIRRPPWSDRSPAQPVSGQFYSATIVENWFLRALRWQIATPGLRRRPRSRGGEHQDNRRRSRNFTQLSLHSDPHLLIPINKVSRRQPSVIYSALFNGKPESESTY
jgi:hypothetical protein